jgi:hypothetical protein
LRLLFSSPQAALSESVPRTAAAAVGDAAAAIANIGQMMATAEEHAVHIPFAEANDHFRAHNSIQWGRKIHQK